VQASACRRSFSGPSPAIRYLRLEISCRTLGRDWSTTLCPLRGTSIQYTFGQHSHFLERLDTPFLTMAGYLSSEGGWPALRVPYEKEDAPFPRLRSGQALCGERSFVLLRSEQRVGLRCCRGLQR